MRRIRQETSHRYSLHQKGTSLSDKAVVPSQYDCSLPGRSNKHNNNIKRVFIYTTLPEYFRHIVVIHIQFLHFVSVFWCSFLKR